MVQEQEVKQFIETHFKKEVKDFFSDLISLGIADSIGIVMFTVSLEKQFKIKIPFEKYKKQEFFSVRSITDCINELRNK